MTLSQEHPSDELSGSTCVERVAEAMDRVMKKKPKQPPITVNRQRGNGNEPISSRRTVLAPKSSWWAVPPDQFQEAYAAEKPRLLLATQTIRSSDYEQRS
jgi:hypothetical protein